MTYDTLTADALTEVAYEFLTEEPEFFECGTPIYGCVCYESLTGRDEAWEHAKTCEPLRTAPDLERFINA